ncbi:hypothetical protein RhiirA1_473670, partial [Rhizophagus irregularis]
MEQISNNLQEIDNSYFQEIDPLRWSLINFLEWRSENLVLNDCNQEHGAFKSLLQKIIINDKDNIYRQKAQGLLNNWQDIKRSPEVVKFWNDRNTQNLHEKIQYVKTHNELKLFQIESEDLNYALDQSKNMNFTAIEDRRKSVLEKALSDDDFMPACIPKRKKLSLPKKNKESVGSAKKAKTTKDTPSSSSSSQGVPRPSPSQGAPNASSSPGVPIPFSSSLESAGSSAEMTSNINEINSSEPRTLPHQNFSYDTSSSSFVCKEHGSKDDTSEDDLLMKPLYVEEIHKQDLMRYNILDTAKSSATEARNLFRKHWGDIIRTIEEFLTSSPDATSLAPESASALTSIDQDIEQDGRADDVKQYIK